MEVLGILIGSWDGLKMMARSWSDFEQSNSIDEYFKQSLGF